MILAYQIALPPDQNEPSDRTAFSSLPSDQLLLESAPHHGEWPCFIGGSLMKRRIAASLTAFSLLLAVAMVCATSAQSPRSEPNLGAAPIQTVPYVVPAPTYPPAAAGASPSKAYSPTGSGPYTFPTVGRYQAVSHEGRLLLIDTANGECWTLEDNTWSRIAPSIAEAQRHEHAKEIKPLESSTRDPLYRLIGD